MVIAALKTLTWGTVATAVVSALLLAWAGGNFPRIASITGDVVRGRLPAAPLSEAAGQRPAPMNGAARSAASAHDASTH